ncbi:MAG: UDP-glucose 4-epimerase GalE [Desulfovibrionaceae bacterium]|nr:UDP-glucose 4-epimerase GalE [Desulfovibrionaceae bacterium]MDD4952081.1 UDP-glucose 4-epimerase GalE [Desulfovibrionaceae bacterium]
MAGQRILVTGGAGYIGSHTARRLIAQNRDPGGITVLDNLERGHPEFVPRGVEFARGDLRDADFVRGLFKGAGFDAVIHFAAYSYVGESMRSPGMYFENNVCGGLNLLRAMADSGCRAMVFSSSCAVYGLPEATPIDEAAPLCPVSPYGETKRAFEAMLEWFDRVHGLRYLALRYFNAAGADFGIGERHEPETHLIPLAVQAALGRRPGIEIFGQDYRTPDGTCVRDYIHVTDLAEAHLLALEHLSRGGASEALNLGTGQGASVRQVIDLVREVSGRDFEVLDGPRRPGDPPVLVASGARARAVLGWRSRRDLREMVESAWRWHRAEA